VNNPGDAFTITFIGDILVGTIEYDLQPGLNLVSSKVPWGGPIPTVLHMPDIPGAQIFTFDEQRQRYEAFIFDDLENKWLPSIPTFFVGDAVWIRVAEPISWSFEFSVNQ
jgi:hypothetical protein